MRVADSPPILVVGAGATGLTLACELARHGAPVRIIDRLPGIVPFARATGVHSQTLEVFHDFGIADEIIAMAAPMRGANHYAGGNRVLHFRYDGLESPFPFAASLEQWKVEQALERLLGSYGATVERNTEFIALDELEEGAIATLRHTNGTTERFCTPWLIGCDGAHSCVRHVKREHFPGEADPRQYLVADVVLESLPATDEMFVYLTEHGAVWLFPLPEGRTLLAADAGRHHDSERELPCLADVQAVIDERIADTVRSSDPRWLSWFNINYRLAPHYRHGHTFLAGDAAHIHSPIGGLGMNTGIQDAYNLAWKLALVTRGLAPESLLDSYETERRAVAQDVLATTRALTEKAEIYAELSPEVREQMNGQIVLPDANRLFLLRHSEELDLDYRRSPICCEYAGTRDDPLTGGPHAGAEAPDAQPLVVAGARRTLFELLRGPRHTLLLLVGLDSARRNRPDALTAMAVEVQQGYGDRVRAWVVLPPDVDTAVVSDGSAAILHDIEGSLHRRYGAMAGRLFLIRPDGYVGLRSEPPQRSALQEYFDLVFRGRWS